MAIALTVLGTAAAPTLDPTEQTGPTATRAPSIATVVLPTAAAVPPTATAVSPSATNAASLACTKNSAFVEDVTLPNGTKLAPGQTLDKIWRVRNVGTCAWGNSYQLVFVGGSGMTAAPLIVVPLTAPGATADLILPMIMESPALRRQVQSQSPPGRRPLVLFPHPADPMCAPRRSPSQ